jgi:hypothetical protein
VTVRLVCPLCRATVVDGREPVSGTCPGCGGEYAGDGATPLEAARTAMKAWGTAGDPTEYADRLFRVDPGDPDVQEAIASDERDGFYRWWVFRRAGA